MPPSDRRRPGCDASPVRLQASSYRASAACASSPACRNISAAPPWSPTASRVSPKSVPDQRPHPALRHCCPASSACRCWSIASANRPCCRYSAPSAFLDSATLDRLPTRPLSDDRRGAATVRPAGVPAASGPSPRCSAPGNACGWRRSGGEHQRAPMPEQALLEIAAPVHAPGPSGFSALSDQAQVRPATRGMQRTPRRRPHPRRSRRAPGGPPPGCDSMMIAATTSPSSTNAAWAARASPAASRTRPSGAVPSEIVGS